MQQRIIALEEEIKTLKEDPVRILTSSKCISNISFFNCNRFCPVFSCSWAHCYYSKVHRRISNRSTNRWPTSWYTKTFSWFQSFNNTWYIYSSKPIVKIVLHLLLHTYYFKSNFQTSYRWNSMVILPLIHKNWGKLLFLDVRKHKTHKGD